MLAKINIILFQKLSIPPPRKWFSLDTSSPPPTPLEISVKLHTITSIFGPLRTPHPPGISNPFPSQYFTPYQKAWILSLQTALYIFKMNTMYLPITDH